MPDIRYVYFCVQTKEEVAAENLDQYLTDYPTHTLIECVRRADAVDNGSVPVIEHLLPPQEQQVIEQVEQIVANPFRPMVMATWSEGACSRYDWLQVGQATAAEVGFVLPFRCRLRVVTVSFSECQSDYQYLELHKGSEGEWRMFATPWYERGKYTQSHCYDNLDGLFERGDVVRARTGYGYGTLKSCVVNAIFEKVD